MNIQKSEMDCTLGERREEREKNTRDIIKL
jgi:hypothetical protein